MRTDHYLEPARQVLNLLDQLNVASAEGIPLQSLLSRGRSSRQALAGHDLRDGIRILLERGVIEMHAGSCGAALRRASGQI